MRTLRKAATTNRLLIIPVVAIATALVIVGTNIIVAPVAVSAINCDNANLGANDQGHIRGNSHCSTGVEPKEPARDCGHKNSDKDNDGDTATICINRG